ncbi:extracellular solute-binding protein [Paenibacillaceae bacterium]|nr:extracellular solute-binding protein [Paenibacillaceae bacterium]
MPRVISITDGTINLKVMIKKAPNQNEWKNLWISGHLNEIWGGTITPIEIDDGSWDEKKNLAFATNDLPDAFMTAGALEFGDLINYGSQGLLIPLNGLIDDHAPNIKKRLADDPNLKKSVTAPDGNIYALPSLTYDKRSNVVGREKPWINSEWLNNLQLDMPTTLDEFYTVLKAFKEQDPNGNGIADEIPVSGSNDNPFKMMVLSALGFVDTTYSTDESGEQVIFVPAQPEYKEYLTFMRMLYKEGLIDSQYFSQNFQAYRAKTEKQLVGFFFDDAAFVAVGADNYKHYEALLPLTSSLNTKQVWPHRNNPSATPNNMAITSVNKSPEATIRLFDYLYSDEGGFLTRMGPDVGVVQSDGGVKRFDDGTWQLTSPEGQSTVDYRFNKVTNLSLPFVMGGPDMPLEKQSEEQANLTENLLKLVELGKPVFPSLFFSPEEQQSMSQINTDLMSYVTQMEAKFIVGDNELSEWDEYLASLEKIGLKKTLELTQTAYERWKNS